MIYQAPPPQIIYNRPQIIMPKRDPSIGLVTGQRSVGKSHKTLSVFQDYMIGNPLTGKVPRKALILDINDEFGNVRSDFSPNFQHIKTLPISRIAEYSRHPHIECRRIRVIDDRGKVMSLDEVANTLALVMENFRGGILLVEDPTKYISDSLSGDLLGKICTLRHRNCDVILHFQYFGKIAHPKFWGSVNYVRVHKTGDEVETYKSGFGGAYQPMKIIEALVNMQFKSGNTRFCAFYQKDTKINSGKITGAFTKIQFVDAIRDYLSRDYDKIVKKEANRKDLDTGKNIYKSPVDAVKGIIENFVDSYYGNAF